MGKPIDCNPPLATSLATTGAVLEIDESDDSPEEHLPSFRGDVLIMAAARLTLPATTVERLATLTTGSSVWMRASLTYIEAPFVWTSACVMVSCTCREVFRAYIDVSPARSGSITVKRLAARLTMNYPPLGSWGSRCASRTASSAGELGRWRHVGAWEVFGHA